MRLTISFNPPDGFISLPVQHNHFLQACLYHCLGDDSSFYHDSGFKCEKRAFRMFCFSRLLGRSVFDRYSGTFRFSGGLRLIVTSPDRRFCSSLATGLLRAGAIHIGERQLPIESIETSEVQVIENQIVVKALSPVVAYSTMTRYNGQKYTCYFAPGDPDYQGVVSDNLRRKHLAFVGSDVGKEDSVKIVPLGDPRLSVVTFKGTVIKGYTCNLLMEGPMPLLQIAVDAGLGAKNSQGFGCLEVQKGAAQHPEGSEKGGNTGAH